MVLAAIVVLAAIASTDARTPGDGGIPAGTGVIVATGVSMLVEAGCSGVGGAEVVVEIAGTVVPSFEVVSDSTEVPSFEVAPDSAGISVASDSKMVVRLPDVPVASDIEVAAEVSDSPNSEMEVELPVASGFEVVPDPVGMPVAEAAELPDSVRLVLRPGSGVGIEATGIVIISGFEVVPDSVGMPVVPDSEVVVAEVAGEPTRISVATTVVEIPDSIVADPGFETLGDEVPDSLGSEAVLGAPDSEGMVKPRVVVDAPDSAGVSVVSGSSRVVGCADTSPVVVPDSVGVLTVPDSVLLGPAVVPDSAGVPVGLGPAAVVVGVPDSAGASVDLGPGTVTAMPDCVLPSPESGVVVPDSAGMSVVSGPGVVTAVSDSVDPDPVAVVEVTDPAAVVLVNVILAVPAIPPEGPAVPSALRALVRVMVVFAPGSTASSTASSTAVGTGDGICSPSVDKAGTKLTWRTDSGGQFSRYIGVDREGEGAYLVGTYHLCSWS